MTCWRPGAQYQQAGSKHGPAPACAEVLADSLGSALLTVEGEGHGIVMRGTNPCVDEIAAEYLIHLTVPEEGATCSP